MSSACQRLSFRFAFIVLVVSFIGGCATATNPRDPLERFNRGVYEFNEAVDKAIFKPVAEVYRAVLPQVVRSAVSNFFSNINDLVVAFNNLLQGKFTTAVSDFSRVVINSSIGLLGLIDVASDVGIEKHDEDFGQTLAVWGMGDGPFIMLPFFGPSNGRDVIGRVGDYFTDPVTYVDPSRSRNQLWGTRVVNRRAELLDASTILQTAALDPYEFVRDAYLQRRRNLIHDGSPPPEKDPSEVAPIPRTQNRAPRATRTYTASAEGTTEGSILVSGEPLVPTLSALPHEPLGTIPQSYTSAPPVQAKQPAPVPAQRVTTASAEVLTPAQQELVQQAKAALVAAPQQPAQERSLFMRVWRYIVEGGTTPRNTANGS